MLDYNAFSTFQDIIYYGGIIAIGDTITYSDNCDNIDKFFYIPARSSYIDLEQVLFDYYLPKNFEYKRSETALKNLPYLFKGIKDNNENLDPQDINVYPVYVADKDADGTDLFKLSEFVDWLNFFGTDPGCPLDMFYANANENGSVSLRDFLIAARF